MRVLPIRFVSSAIVALLASWPAVADDEGPAAAIVERYESELTGKKDVPVPLFCQYRKRLVSLGSSATLDLCHTILHTRCWKVKLLAVSSLEKIRDARAIPALLHALKDRTPLGHSFNGWSDPRTAKYRIRQDAAEALKALGRQALDELRPMARDRRHPDHANAVYALSVMAGPEAIALLVPIARDGREKAEVRRDAIFGIAQGETRDIGVLAELLGDAKVRKDVTEALERKRNKKAIPALARLLPEAAENFEAAQAAAGAIWQMTRGKWKPARVNECVDFYLLADKASSIAGAVKQPAVPRLADWGWSENPIMQKRAIWALGRYHSDGRNPDTAATNALLELLEHVDANVRREVASALSNKRDRRAIPHIIQKMATDAANRKYYSNVLRCWTREDLGTDSVRWLEWWEANRETFRR